jgi:LPXTG-motif cell wall-anchored protein
MRRKLSLLSGFAAAILFIFPIGSITYADELAANLNPNTTVTSQSSTVTTTTTETPQSNSDETPATETPQSNSDETPATETPQSSSDATPATETPQSNSDAAPATETPQSNSDAAPATEAPQSITDSTTDPSQNSTDTTDVTGNTAPNDTSGGSQPTSTDGTAPDGSDSGNLGDISDFYHDSPALSSGLTTNDGVVFDYSAHQESMFDLWFSFSPEDINLLKQNNPDPKVIVKKGDITASLPLNTLPTDPTYKGFDFGIAKDSQTTFANALSPVYNFTISYMDFKNFNPFNFMPQFVQDFTDNPVLLTFKIDPAKVKNWDDVRVRSIDWEGTFQNDPIEIVNMDQETGEITAKVQNFNFNGYGVFEGESGTDTTIGSGDNGSDSTGDPSSTDPSSDDQSTSTDGNPSDNGSGTPVDFDYYNDSPTISSGTTTNNGVVFDYSNHSESLFELWFSFSPEDINLLKQNNPNPMVIVKRGDITASLPLNILPTDSNNKGFMFDVFKDSETSYANALSPVYNFAITYMDLANFDPYNLGFLKSIQDFVDNPVQLTFKIDPTKVENWDDVQVRSIDWDGTFQNDPIEIVNMDKTTGEITAKVPHFYDLSGYGVFETSTGSNNNDNSSTGTTGTDPTGTDITATDGSSNSSKGTVTSNGVEFNYPNQAGSLALNLNLSQDDVKLLKNSSTNPSIIVDKGNIKVSLPLNGLPTDPNSPDSILPFGINIGLDSNSYSNALSPVYNFSIPFTDPLTGNQMYQHDFSKNPVLLTFKVDPAKVKNWNDVQVKYIDDNGTIQSEPIEIVSKNQETGEIVAKVLHFSRYGVFEIASTNETGTPGTIISTGTPTTNSTSSTGTPTTTNSTSSSVATNGNIASAAVTANTVATTSSLPSTASNSHNILMLGLTLIALGGFMFSFRNRNLKQSK